MRSPELRIGVRHDASMARGFSEAPSGRHVMKSGDASLELLITPDGEAVVIAVGELDLATERLLDDVLDMAQRRVSTIHLDLGAVAFIDVRTVNVLERWARTCMRLQGRLQVQHSKGQPRRILQLCGLGGLLD